MTVEILEYSLYTVTQYTLHRVVFIIVDVLFTHASALYGYSSITKIYRWENFAKRSEKTQ